MEEILHASHGSGPIEIDGEGWLNGTNISRFPSVKQQSLWPGETHVLGIVLHFTDTRSVGAAQLAQRIIGSSGRAASWHLCIDRLGFMAQSVSACRGSWHAGGRDAARFETIGLHDDEWSTPAFKRRLWSLAPSSRHDLPGANSLFFGVELENVGEVRLVDGEWLGWPFKRGGADQPIAVPSDEVISAGLAGGITRGWHTFTGPQLASLELVIHALASKYQLLRENCAWTHQQIDPKNRTDPGPLMVAALPGIIARAFGS